MALSFLKPSKSKVLVTALILAAWWGTKKIQWLIAGPVSAILYPDFNQALTTVLEEGKPHYLAMARALNLLFWEQQTPIAMLKSLFIVMCIAFMNIVTAYTAACLSFFIYQKGNGNAPNKSLQPTLSAHKPGGQRG